METQNTITMEHCNIGSFNKYNIAAPAGHSSYHVQTKHKCKIGYYMRTLSLRSIHVSLERTHENIIDNFKVYVDIKKGL